MCQTAKVWKDNLSTQQRIQGALDSYYLLPSEETVSLLPSN
jgi:hypothetical protein